MLTPFLFCIVCVILVSYNSVLCQNDEEKRLVLHSETDLLQEFTNLKSEFESYKSQSTAVNAKLTSDINSLNAVNKQMTTDITALQTSNNQLTMDINTLKTDTNAATRAVYTRWGRNVCPLHTEMVYKGYMGGKKYTETGSGNNNLCLPSDPTWGNYSDSPDSNRGYIYGTEIDHDDSNHLFPYAVNQQDMPCVVCRTNKSTSLMIPARNDCYPGWKLEYKGYLMSNAYNHHASYDYICMDQRPEFLQHGATNDNDHVVYMVEGHCGSLPCPPYVQNRELACVVCSK